MGTTLSYAEETSPEGDYLRLECERGTMVYSQGSAMLYKLEAEGEGMFSTEVKKISLDPPAEEAPENVNLNGHLELIGDLVSAILDDRAPYITGESARIGVDLVLSVYESSRQGKKVSVRHI